MDDLGEQVLCQGVYGARLLGQGDELGWADHAQFFVMPARQGFKANDFSGTQIHFGLVMREDPTFANGHGQFAVNFGFSRGGCQHLGIEPLDLIAPGFLGAQQRCIRIDQQLIDRLRVIRKQGGPSAERRSDLNCAHVTDVENSGFEHQF